MGPYKLARQRDNAYILDTSRSFESLEIVHKPVKNTR